MPVEGDGHDSTIARLIGRSRLIVIVAVAAVLLAAFSLFMLGAWTAIAIVWGAWQEVASGEVGTTELVVRFLEIVTVMLKAVFFYLIGVGLYSLFIAPLNVTVALGIETLNDLETKIISVVIVIMAVAFLERFIQHGPPMEVLQEAAALGIVVAALVLFKFFTTREGQEARLRRDQDLARREMFERAHEQQDVPDPPAERRHIQDPR
jgi:uncharacterized membrane protein YqhA